MTRQPDNRSPQRLLLHWQSAAEMLAYKLIDLPRFLNPGIFQYTHRLLRRLKYRMASSVVGDE